MLECGFDGVALSLAALPANHINDNSIIMDDKIHDKLFDDKIHDKLFALAQKEDWNAVIERLKQAPNAKALLFLSQFHIRSDEQGTLLHLACSSSAINKSIMEELLKLAGPGLVLMQDPLGHTPLVDAFSSGAPCEVVELLITTSPASVHVKDNLCLTPLDHVCERIIMREERHRYYAASEGTNNNTDAYLYECARLMLQALGQPEEDTPPNNDGEKTMMMHACIQAHSYCPLALRQRIMKRYAHQLKMPDRQGNLPLHIAARTIVDEDEDVEVIQQVLKAYPDAIRVVNQDGNLPLDEAIRAGRTWSTGAQILFEAFPEAILGSEHYPVPPANLAVVWSEIARKGSVDSLYRILHGQPELFRRSTATL